MALLLVLVIAVSSTSAVLASLQIDVAKIAKATPPIVAMIKGTDDARLTRTTRWKSLRSGTTKIVRINRNYLYVESVRPDKEKNYNLFSITALKRNPAKRKDPARGDIYEGVLRYRSLCDYDRGHSCTLEEPITITILTPTRIEGWLMTYPGDTKSNCKKCKWPRPPETRVKSSFTWIAE